LSYRVLDPYPRRAHLDFYLRNPNPFYSVTFELDATRVRARAKELGASTFAAMIWCWHRAMLPLAAFRTRLVGGEVRLYDTLAVGMTVPAPERTFSFATLPFDEDAAAWLPRARAEMERASSGIDLSGGAAPDFAYYTALPKVPFTSFTHVHLADPLAGQPETAFGRFREGDGRTVVPVGVLVNHLYVDGADLRDLYEAAAESFARGF